MPLTPEEEKELQSLEKEFSSNVSVAEPTPSTTPEAIPKVEPKIPDIGTSSLTPDEETELAQLETEFAEPQRETTLGENLSERVEKALPSSGEGFVVDVAFPFKAGVRATGQVIGGIGDIVVAGINKLFEKVVPEKAKQFIESGVRSVLETDTGKAGIEALQSGADAYQDFKTKNPEVAVDIESVLNIATAVPIGRITKPIVKETFDIAGDVISPITRKSISQIDNQITQRINKDIPRAVKPKVSGRKTFPQIEKFQQKSQSAVENIIANKEGLKFIDESGLEVVGRLPQNIDEFGQAITQTKAKIFDDFDSLIKMAGKKGAEVDTEKIAQELRGMFDISETAPNKKQAERFRRLSPSTAREAERLADEFTAAGKFTPADAEAELEILNRTLKAFYDSPSPDSASVAYVHSLVANNIRKQLDDVITKSTGEGFQELKNAYGALRSIEEDVGASIFREAKKGNPGLVVDFGNVLSSTAALQGILTSNPKLAIAAGAGKIVVDIFKKFREPNRLIEEMFKDVDSLIIKRADTGFNPKSKLGTRLRTRITKAQQRGIQAEQELSVTELSKGRAGTPIPPKEPSVKTSAISKGQEIEGAEILTGDPFIDEKISIALRTPPSLRDAEQKFMIDIIKRKP